MALNVLVDSFLPQSEKFGNERVNMRLPICKMLRWKCCVFVLDAVLLLIVLR